jgi:hypothetical protein
MDPAAASIAAPLDPTMKERREIVMRGRLGRVVCASGDGRAKPGRRRRGTRSPHMAFVHARVPLRATESAEMT